MELDPRGSDFSCTLSASSRGTARIGVGQWFDPPRMGAAEEVQVELGIRGYWTDRLD